MSVISAEILQTFTALLEEAKASADPEPTAMTVATVGKGGRPSARTVLLKGFDARGFVFYTNFTSRKGQQLAANPQAALLFHWKMRPRRRAGEDRGQRGAGHRGRGRRLFRRAAAAEPDRRLGLAAVADAGIAGSVRGADRRSRKAVSKAWTCRGRRIGRASGSCPS